jgi:hypothetical protein
LQACASDSPAESRPRRKSTRVNGSVLSAK